MRNYLAKLFVAFFAITAVSVVQAADKVDMTGIWNLAVSSSRGNGNPTFTLKQVSNKLTGKYEGFFGKAPVTGTVKGHTFEMKYTLQRVTVVYKGKVEGKKMSGTVDFGGMGKGTFTGKRK